MSYVVALRKNETGEVRLCPQEFAWNEASDYWWIDGNMACDCNRELEFERATGKTYAMINPQCSMERFTALYAELPDGTRIPLDDADEP